MKTETPSATARKVALNIVTLGFRGSMKEILPPGSSEATPELLVAGGVVRKGVEFFGVAVN